MDVLSNRHGERKRDGAAHRPATTAIKFQRLVGNLHALGVRPTAELLIEHVGDDVQAGNTLLLLLEKYGRLDPAAVQALGADVFPPAPLHEVRG